MIDTLGNTIDWFTRAVPKIEERNQRVQTGVHFEEVAEMLDELSSTDSVTEAHITQARNAIRELATHLKKNVVPLSVRDCVGYLDALCDQIVTASGVGHMHTFDMLGAMAEVNGSNWSKFVDGLPIFDENGKIQKGPDYYEADLRIFI